MPAPKRRPPQPVAVFDMDGVLIHGDAFSSFTSDRLRRSPVHLAAVAGAWPWLAAPLTLRRTRNAAVRELLRVALAGLDDRRFGEAVEAVGAVLAGRPERVVHQAVAAAQEHLDAGGRVVVATACEERLARAYLDGIGLADAELCATQIAFGRLGIQVRRHNHGATKVVALRELGVKPRWSVAYTDALSDVPLLEGAERPVLVNPDDWLRTRVRRSLGRDADEVAWPAPRRADRTPGPPAAP